ncbi:MAG: beta-ketoacyl synthase N-terminal-like domain-containing protein, partial [Pseudomonadota bacterium]
MNEMREAAPIAVVGLGALFPGRGTTQGFWRDLVEAVDTTGPVPETHWLARDYYDPDPSRPDHTYSHRGAFIPAFAFDPVENGLPPRVIETTDTVQLMALHVARAVLAEAEAGLAAPIARERIGVVLGVAAGTELMQDMSCRLSRPMLLNALRADGLDEPRALRIADRFSAHFSEWRESTFP